MVISFIFVFFNISFFCQWCSQVNVEMDVMSKYIKNGFKTERLTANLTTKEDMNEFWPNFLDKDDMHYYDEFENWPKTKEEVLEYLEGRQFRPNVFYFAIKLNENGKRKVIGQLNFKFLRKGVLTLSYWIAKAYRRKGYLKEIGFKFIEELFFKLKKVNTLEIFSDDMNVASRGYILSLYNYLKERHNCEMKKYVYSNNSEVINFYYIYK